MCVITGLKDWIQSVNLWHPASEKSSTQKNELNGLLCTKKNSHCEQQKNCQFNRNVCMYRCVRLHKSNDKDDDEDENENDDNNIYANILHSFTSPFSGVQLQRLPAVQSLISYPILWFCWVQCSGKMWTASQRWNSMAAVATATTLRLYAAGGVWCNAQSKKGENASQQ